MADERLRELERRYLVSGTLEDLDRLEAEAVRTGRSCASLDETRGDALRSLVSLFERATLGRTRGLPAPCGSCGRESIVIDDLGGQSGAGQDLIAFWCSAGCSWEVRIAGGDGGTDTIPYCGRHVIESMMRITTLFPTVHARIELWKLEGLSFGAMARPELQSLPSLPDPGRLGPEVVEFITGMGVTQWTPATFAPGGVGISSVGGAPSE